MGPSFLIATCMILASWQMIGLIPGDQADRVEPDRAIADECLWWSLRMQSDCVGAQVLELPEP